MHRIVRAKCIKCHVFTNATLMSLHSYGSKGTTIIMHTLLQLFPPSSTTTDAFKPLPLLHYFSYFLVPHIISRFICEDCKKGSQICAYSIMTASSDAGESINPERDDDDEVDTINHRTTVALKQAAINDQQEVEMAAKVLISLQSHKPQEVGVDDVGFMWSG